MPRYRAQFCVGDLSDESPRPSLAYCLSAINWLRQNARKYDVIHGLSGYWYSLVPLAVARGLFRDTPPIVLKMVGSSGGPFLPRGHLHRARNAVTAQSVLARQVDSVIALDQEMFDQLVRRGREPDRIALIPNGVDTERFHPVSAMTSHELRRSLGWADIATVLSVGGLASRKGQDLLIDAVALLQSRLDRPIQLVLAGPERETGLKKTLQRLADQKMRAGSLIFEDHRTDIERLYQAADVFALCSSEEGMSNALLEAMASGLPTLATNIAGNRSVVRDGDNGLLVDSDPQAVAVALERLLLRDSDEFRERSRATACREFSYAHVWSEHRLLFERLSRKPCTAS